MHRNDSHCITTSAVLRTIVLGLASQFWSGTYTVTLPLNDMKEYFQKGPVNHMRIAIDEAKLDVDMSG